MRQIRLLLPPMPHLCNALTDCNPIYYINSGIVATKNKNVLLFLKVPILLIPLSLFLSRRTLNPFFHQKPISWIEKKWFLPPNLWMLNYSLYICSQNCICPLRQRVLWVGWKAAGKRAQAKDFFLYAERKQVRPKVNQWVEHYILEGVTDALFLVVSKLPQIE